MSSDADILIVEDEPVVVAAARKILVSEGFSVDAVMDVPAALQKLRDNDYRLTLTDLMLPGPTGFELIRQAALLKPSVPIILFTGYATVENAVRSFAEGVFDFIPKPFSPEELLGVIVRGMGFQAKAAVIRGCYRLGWHSWMKLEPDGTAVFGAGESFFQTVKEIQEIEFPAVGSEISQGNEGARLITADGIVHRVWAPLSGKVIATNSELKRHLAWLRDDPVT